MIIGDMLRGGKESAEPSVSVIIMIMIIYIYIKGVTHQKVHRAQLLCKMSRYYDSC